MKVLAIIPAYNEETTIHEVIAQTKPFVSDIVVVNDGSKDTTETIAKEAGAIVLSLPINRGLGSALRTGFLFAQVKEYDIAVTLDADLQHDPSEIPKFIEKIEKGAHVVIGSRLLNKTGHMPWYRTLFNKVGNIITPHGNKTTDSQSGFRAFSLHALQTFELKSERMEISSEIIGETFRKKLAYAEVPIKAIYTTYSLSKGQSIIEGLRTLWRLHVVSKFLK